MNRANRLSLSVIGFIYSAESNKRPSTLTARVSPFGSRHTTNKFPFSTQPNAHGQRHTSGLCQSAARFDTLRLVRRKPKMLKLVISSPWLAATIRYTNDVDCRLPNAGYQKMRIAAFIYVYLHFGFVSRVLCVCACECECGWSLRCVAGLWSDFRFGFIFI